MKRFVLPVLCALGVIWLVGMQLAKSGQGNIIVKKNIVYGKGGDTDLQLDLAMPKGAGPFPAVVCVHGGGWRGGKRQDMNKLTELLAQKGFVAITPTYRFSQQAKFPAQIEDVKAAVRWLRANADKYKVDADHIGAVGFSAGGHLVSLLGTADKSARLEGQGGHPDQSSRVQAVVSYFGPTDFVTKRWEKKVEDFFLVPFLGGSYDEAKDMYAKASPVKYISKDDPPFLFFHGDQDKLVGLHNSVDMAKELKEAGVPAEVVIMKGDAHGWGGEKLQRTVNQTIEFFEEKLKK